MKKFLLNTWYGAFSVWAGVSAALLLILCLERFLKFRFPGGVGVWVCLSLMALILITGIIFFVAWIVSLVKRRWKRALLQAVLGVATAAGFLWALGALFIGAMFDPSEDNFADNLTIPPEIEKDILIPRRECNGSFSTASVYDDDFAKRVFERLEGAGGDDPIVKYDLACLANLVHCRREELMQYLAKHPGWWLHEERGNLCATRRLRVAGVWNHPLHGYYSGNLRQTQPGEDFETQQKATYYQMRTTIGLPFSPFG